MTICASVKVRDGLVLGTDSMSQIHGQVRPNGPVEFLKSYSNASKLFKVKDLSVGVMSYGIGNIGNRSIQGLISDFDLPEESSRTVEEITRSLFGHFGAVYETEYSAFPPDQRPALGFFVAGYSEGAPFPEEWEFVFPRDADVQPVRPRDQFGASWRGVDIPFTRLYMGYDPRLPQMLIDAGVDPNAVQQMSTVVQQLAEPVVFDGMPVQDAINFGAYILRTTIGISTFEAGVPSCGGPLQMATILPDGRFEWVAKPEFSVEVV